MLMISEYFNRLVEYLSNGGPVMIPLLALSVMMWVFIIHRAYFFRRLYRHNMSRKKAAELVLNNQSPDPKQYKGAVALLVRDFLNRRSHSPELDAYILDETVMSLVGKMDSHLSLINVLAGIAPLLGLLGTVTGMITTFDIISYFGTGNARAMAGGISEALITTQTGLLVAIPGLYMSNFLKRRAHRLKQRIAAVGIYLKQYV